MGERIIITDEPKPAPEVIVVKEQPAVKVEKTVTENVILKDERAQD